jgi:CRP-like cAMP-binding protein
VPHTTPSKFDRNALLSRFERVFALTEDEQDALAAFPVRLATVKAGQHVVRAGDRPSRSALVVDGLSCTSKTTDKGRRQITAFHIKGDMPDLHSLHLSVLDTDLQTVTDCTIAFMEHGALKKLSHDHPRIAASMWRTTLVDGAIYREWVTNIGQREAKSRIAHLFCEMLARNEAVGLADGDSCEFRVSQSMLAEAAGISSVHVNRSLQALRSEGLISFEGGILTIPNRERLEEEADFDPTYLHLGENARAN